MHRSQVLGMICLPLIGLLRGVGMDVSRVLPLAAKQQEKEIKEPLLSLTGSPQHGQ